MNSNYEIENTFGILDGDKFYPRVAISSGTMRVIVTTKCNYACPHCFKEGEVLQQHRELDSDFLIRVLGFAHKYYGVNSIKISGGEPLLFENLDMAIKKIKDIGIKYVDITTNGYFLKEKINILVDNNIKYITVTLNTLDSDLYQKIHNSPKDGLERVLDGIMTAKKNGIKVRLNVVALDIEEQNIDEIIEFARDNNIVMRICEPTYIIGAKTTKDKSKFKKTYECISEGAISIVESTCQSVDYIKTKEGTDITVMRNLCDNRYCESCGKYLYIRLTSDGKLKPCLSRTDTEVKIPQNPSDEELDKCFAVAVSKMGKGLEFDKPIGLDLGR